MSAPDTNVNKQTRRHRGPIIGIALVLAFAAVLFLGLLGYVWEPAETAGEVPAAAATVSE
ncbi:hypothetical protein SAMN04488515_1521 [Cognatiyoonia koreensis]|uniref:Uncharacterized protein n=1 Tax=Cognatiyoonia koreensis TaxID=364200 RepID=A0A1I0PY06_9RHOB|nr:hypothetical protein [Cognatiyoonia koreensis]SEW19403.1 hypothetical protein SAMN04488515_1521 [Cognatiyoonia koreensis]